VHRPISGGCLGEQQLRQPALSAASLPLGTPSHAMSGLWAGLLVASMQACGRALPDRAAPDVCRGVDLTAALLTQFDLLLGWT
jgi:hypothetical protein